MGKEPIKDAQGFTKVSSAERGIALAFAGAVLVVLIFLVLNPRFMDDGTLAIVRFLAAAFAGISGYLFSGTLGLEAKIPFSKTQIRATGAFAAFIIVLLLFFYGLPKSTVEDQQAYQEQELIENARKADVIVAKFDERSSVSIEIGRRIESALKKGLQQAQINDAAVEFLPLTIKSEAEALKNSQSNTTAVIWGWYDDYEIRVRLFLPEQNRIEKFNEIPFEIGREPSTEIEFVVRDDLPRNVSFLTFLIAGQKRYNENKYSEGYRYYDAAMNNIPENVKIENEEVVSFLSARKIQSSGVFSGEKELFKLYRGETLEFQDELVSTVCGYTDSIDKNSSFSEAYNNLGVVLAEHSDLEAGLDPILQIRQVKDCLETLPITLDREALDKVFGKALEFRADWSLPVYNLATYKYNSRFYSGNSPTVQDELKEILEKVIRIDDSLYGAYVMLANIEIELDNLNLAITHLSNALSIVQTLRSLSGDVISNLYANTGQVYIKLSEYAKAEIEFENALGMIAENSEALLGLSHVFMLDGKYKNAFDSINLISEIEPKGLGDSGSALYTAKILESFIYFKEGRYESAVSSLQEIDLNRASLPNYILGLLYGLEGDTDLSENYLEKSEKRYEGTSYWDRFNHRDNNTALLSWADLYQECFRQSQASGEQLKSSDACDPNFSKEHIAYVYDIFLSRLTDRLFYRGGLFIIGG